jgi:hypothetical protein
MVIEKVWNGGCGANIAPGRPCAVAFSVIAMSELWTVYFTPSFRDHLSNLPKELRAMVTRLRHRTSLVAYAVEIPYYFISKVEQAVLCMVGIRTAHVVIPAGLIMLCTPEVCLVVQGKGSIQITGWRHRGGSIQIAG